jgi:hypothetical protein
MLRRAIRPFAVEVRRRPRLATTANPNAQSSATKPPPAAFDRESRRAGVAACGAQEADRSPVVDVAASQPTGRILPSLVSDEPRHRRLEDAPVSAADSEPLSRAPNRQSGRAPKREGQASKSPRNSSLLSSENGAFVGAGGEPRIFAAVCCVSEGGEAEDGAEGPVLCLRSEGQIFVRDEVGVIGRVGLSAGFVA